MPLTNDEKEAMRAATYEAAIAFVDDLNFMRRTLGNNRPTAGDVRRLSVIIRRFLLDGHLQAVSAPRIGRHRLLVPDFEHWITQSDFDFITVGFPPLFGWTHGLFEFYRIEKFKATHDGNANLQLAPALPAPMREVTVSRLLSDRVVRAQGDLLSRLDFLQFVCYHDFGVHYSGREESAFTQIRRIRHFLCFCTSEDGILSVSVSGDNSVGKKPSRMLLDLAHAHTLATGYYLTISPDIARLEALIEAEAASAEASAKDGPD